MHVFDIHWGGLLDLVPRLGPPGSPGARLPWIHPLGQRLDSRFHIHNVHMVERTPAQRKSGLNFDSDFENAACPVKRPQNFLNARTWPHLSHSQTSGTVSRDDYTVLLVYFNSVNGRLHMLEGEDPGACFTVPSVFNMCSSHT